MHLATPRAGAFARVSRNKARTAARRDAWRLALYGRVVRPRLPSDSKSPDEKTRSRFPGAGFKIPAMMKLCR